MDNRALSHQQSGGGVRKYVKPAMALAIFIGSAVCANAWADRGSGGHGHGGHGWHGGHGGHHGHGAGIGVVIGAPLYWNGAPWYGYPRYGYGDPYYGYPGYPSYGYRYYQSVPVAPPVYIERGVQPATGQWYFCSNPEGYYPYVTQCSTAWRVVAPQSVVR